MTFANPAAFWGLLLAVPLVAVYLIRNRPSTRTVSTLLFWEQVSEEPAATSLFRTLRNPGSLLFQLLILAIMILALSRPAFRSLVGNADRQIVLIDNSASMRAVDEDGVSRFDSAIVEANKIIEAASPGTDVVIMVSCPSPTVVCPPTTSPALAQIRLRELSPTDCVGQLEVAQRFALAVTGKDIDSSIVVITDGNESVDSEIVADEATDDSESGGDGPLIRSSTILVGEDLANVGITGFQARRDASDPTLWQLYYEVSNFGDDPVEVNLELRQEETLIDILPLQLDPGQSDRGVLSRTSTEGGLVAGRLRATDLKNEWSDALSIDDAAMTSVSGRPRIGVTLVTSGNWFLQQVLSANPLIRLNVVEEYDAAQTDTAGIVVFDSVVPEAWPPTGSRFPIRSLVVAPSGSCRLWTVDGVIDQTFVGDYQAEHPLIEYVQLEDIAINSATSLTVKGSSEIIVSAIEGQPLLTTFDDGQNRVIMLAVDLERSDLPLRTSFPILLTNAMDWLVKTRPDLLPQATTGSATTISVGDSRSSQAQSESWFLKHPDGTSEPVPVVGGAANLGQLTQVGIYSLQPGFGPTSTGNVGDSSTDSILVPCNLTSKQESQLQRIATVGSSEDSRQESSTGLQWSLQGLLLVALLLTIVAECWMWHRRVIE